MGKNVMYFLFFLFLQQLFYNTSIANAGVYVMPEQYAFVISNTATGDGYSTNGEYDSDWFANNVGGISKWQKIELWGRCSYDYIGKQYKWVYGTNACKDSGWIPITKYNFNYLTNWVENDTVLYADTVPSDIAKSYATMGDESITFYPAKLLIGDGSVVFSTHTLMVKVANFKHYDEYTANIRETQELIILESIAKGKGLSFLYRNDNYYNNNISSKKIFWYGYSDCLVGSTALALMAYLVHGHSVYDPEGVKDIFVETVDNGFNYLLSQAVVVKNSTVKIKDCPSDINNDNIMLHFFTPYSINNTDYAMPYEHGMAMTALAVSRNYKRQNTYVDVGKQKTSMLYSDVIKDAVDFASYTQGESSYTYTTDILLPPYGAWDYAVIPTNRADLSIIQWPILGLAAIEANWGENFRAPDFVRDRLVKGVIQRVQAQDPDNTVDFTDYYGMQHIDGGAWYMSWHAPLTSTSYSNVTDTNLYTLNAGYSNSGHWFVSTNSLLECCYYASLDISGPTTICGCGDGPGFLDGGQNCNSIGTDLTYFGRDNRNSCRRVKHAVNFIGRRWNELIDSADYYGWYVIMKSLRLYNIERGKIDDGVLIDENNEPFFWEEKLVKLILKRMDDEGSWYGGRWHQINDTSFAVLTLGEEVYKPGSLKTELLKQNNEMFGDDKGSIDLENCIVYNNCK